MASGIIDHIYVLPTVVRPRLQEGKVHIYLLCGFPEGISLGKQRSSIVQNISYGINGKFYRAIRCLYKSPVACVEINSLRTGWFPTTFGVKQGDILSPTLFSLLN